MRRTWTLLVLLAKAGPRGVDTDSLIEHCGYRARDRDDAMRMFQRDRRALQNLGWRITNLGGGGRTGRYRLEVGDNRLRVQLTPGQRAALVRAAAAVGDAAIITAVEDGTSTLTEGPALRVRDTHRAPHLDLLLRAVTRRCLVTFDYSGSPRTVHPHLVTSGPNGWYLVGVEDGAITRTYPERGSAGPGPAKSFLASRMSNVAIAEPGTADEAPAPTHPTFDPLSWSVDPPTTVVVATAPDHEHILRHLLGAPDGRRTGPDGRRTGPAAAVDAEADVEVEVEVEVELTYTVANRAAFRARIYELADRVRVLGPQQFRDEMLLELSRIAGRAP